MPVLRAQVHALSPKTPPVLRANACATANVCHPDGRCLPCGQMPALQRKQKRPQGKRTAGKRQQEAGRRGASAFYSARWDGGT